MIFTVFIVSVRFGVVKVNIILNPSRYIYNFKLMREEKIGDERGRDTSNTYIYDVHAFAFFQKS